MISILEIVVEIFCFILSVWLIYKGYAANKAAKPFSFKDLSFSESVDSAVSARALIIGIGLLILLIAKLASCGLVCWV